MVSSCYQWQRYTQLIDFIKYKQKYLYIIYIYILQFRSDLYHIVKYIVITKLCAYLIISFFVYPLQSVKCFSYNLLAIGITICTIYLWTKSKQFYYIFFLSFTTFIDSSIARGNYLKMIWHSIFTVKIYVYVKLRRFSL